MKTINVSLARSTKQMPLAPPLPADFNQVLAGIKTWILFHINSVYIPS